MDLKTTILAAVCAFGLSALASIALRGGSAAGPVEPATRPDVAASGVSYASLLADTDEHIAGLQKVVDKRANDWLIRTHLATALSDRASLTHSLDDYDRVQAVLDETFAMVPPGTGPLLLAARFNFSIHRLTEAEKYLDMIDRRAVPRGEETAMARTLRAEIAMQRGQYDVARATLAEVPPKVGGAALALYHAKTGDPAEAEALLTEALATASEKDPRHRAWLDLQLGVLAMDRGELLTALKHLQNADAELAGWWLVQEHVAEVHSRRAEHDKAVAIYEDLVRTTDLPQHMDALAGLHRHTGKPEAAAELITRAAARWEEQLTRYREAAIGHSLQHHLQFGEPQRALELALGNHALRPGGDAEVALARAYLKAGQPAEALAAAERALATPYRSAALHDVAAKAHAALGNTAAAEEQVALCLAINPRYTSTDHSH